MFQYHCFSSDDYKKSTTNEINKWQTLFSDCLLQSSKLQYLYNYTSEKYDLLALPINDLVDARKVLHCLAELETNLTDLGNDVEDTLNLYGLLIEHEVAILPEDERQLNFLTEQYKKLNIKVILAKKYNNRHDKLLLICFILEERSAEKITRNLPFTENRIK